MYVFALLGVTAKLTSFSLAISISAFRSMETQRWRASTLILSCTLETTTTASVAWLDLTISTTGLRLTSRERDQRIFRGVPSLAGAACAGISKTSMVRAAVELVATACWAWRLKSTLSRWPEVASFGRYPTRSTHSSQQLLDRTHDHRHTGLDLRSPRPALLSAVAALTAPGQQKTSLYPSYFDVDLFFHSEHMDRTTLASGIIFSHGVYTWQMHTVCSALLCCLFSRALAAALARWP
jgi:hypothetical protein